MSTYIDSLLHSDHSIYTWVYPHFSPFIGKALASVFSTFSLCQKPSFAISNLHFNVDEMPYLREMMVERKVKRRQYILQKEQVCRHYFLVTNGCLRLFQIDKKGIEHNLFFAAENEWLTDLDSFYNDIPSKVYIEAVEFCTIMLIKKEDLIALFISNPEIQRIFRIIAELRAVELQERMFHLISSSAEERYVAFVSKFPHLTARLPSKEIASLIGITPEFLCRVRKDLLMK